VTASVERLMHDNLLAVFGERDAAKRQAAIARTYAPTVRWTDAEGVTEGHAALETKCVALQSGLGPLEFEPVGPVHELPGFGYLAWRLVDPVSGQAPVSGFDTVLIADGVITDLWTVVIPAEAAG
jgi:hypothetical protein